MSNVKLTTIVKFLDKELKIKSIKDKCKNGLQVRGSGKVTKVGLSTDACMDVFEKAKKLGCDLVIVHHGLLWKGEKDKAGIVKKRYSFLKKNKISLYASHLPLDKNKIYGNNTSILKLLGVKPVALFGEVGYFGYLKKPTGTEALARLSNKKLKTKSKILKFGKNKNKKIAVVSGYGGEDIPKAVKKNIDVYVTGEISHSSYHKVKEGKINLIAAGHYKTETVGVKNLGKLLENKFKVKSVFIDSPTGM